MYATLVKLRYAWTSIALLIVIILISLWYRQPVNLYGLDSNLQAQTIHVYVTQVPEGAPEGEVHETRTASFREGEENFDEALAKLESLELVRPARNLMPLPLPKKSDAPKDIDGHDYRLRIEIEGPEDRTLALICDMNDWEYRKSSYDADMPLKTTENTETSKNLGDFFWELAE